MNALAPIGRGLYAVIFLFAAPQLFTSQAIAMAAANGTPVPNLAVPIAGILALVGGLSVLLGYRAHLGAFALVLFLIPVTLIMHRFWGLADQAEAQMQVAQFMKNVALLGGAVFFIYAGAGAYSLDARAHRTTAWGHV